MAFEVEWLKGAKDELDAELLDSCLAFVLKDKNRAIRAIRGLYQNHFAQKIWPVEEKYLSLRRNQTRRHDED